MIYFFGDEDSCRAEEGLNEGQVRLLPAVSGAPSSASSHHSPSWLRPRLIQTWAATLISSRSTLSGTEKQSEEVPQQNGQLFLTFSSKAKGRDPTWRR